MKISRFSLAHTVIVCALVLLGACRTTPNRVPADEVTEDPAFDRVEMVDVAILAPVVQHTADEVLASNIRDECRKVLIERKEYSVPADGFVDKTLAGRNLPPEQTAGILGSDGVLLVTITGWDTADLIPRGRLWAAGEVVLYGSGKPLWRRTFKDKSLLASAQVTPTNRSQSESEIMRSLVRDMLSSLPRKRQR